MVDNWIYPINIIINSDKLRIKYEILFRLQIFIKNNQKMMRISHLERKIHTLIIKNKI